MPTAIAEFHPAVRAWFERRFDSPSRAQELGWPVIGAANEPPGFDVLLCAPTGSGKTLAAFIWAINGLVLEAERRLLRDDRGSATAGAPGLARVRRHVHRVAVGQCAATWHIFRFEAIAGLSW